MFWTLLLSALYQRSKLARGFPPNPGNKVMHECALDSSGFHGHIGLGKCATYVDDQSKESLHGVRNKGQIITLFRREKISVAICLLIKIFLGGIQEDLITFRAKPGRSC